MLFDQLPSTNLVTGGQGVPDGLVDETVLCKPGARPGMERGYLIGTEMSPELIV
jgi:hypothetical protein